MSPRRLTSSRIFLLSVLVLVMLADIRHSYLFSMDEPREAEIARETLVGGHWITPHLSGLPFLEKPPLFYDTVAITYFLAGAISPTAARLVPLMCGIIMLAAVFSLCRSCAGERMAWLSVLVLISLPKFFYHSHTILLDIAVGAFCTTAIAAFALWLWVPASDTKKQALLCLFYLASAGAFLSKGVIGIFHVVVIVGLFCLVSRQWDTLRKLMCAWPIFLFIVPVTVWVYLFYREGGYCYLHELFVHNVLGRFLGVHFEMPDCPIYNVDLGKIEPWYFYLNTLPTIVGAAIIVLPLALWDALKRTVASLRHGAHNRDVHTNTKLLLLIWAIAPVLLLSFSAAKEISYILPSYAAMAILVGAWLDERLGKNHDSGWSGIFWLSVAAIVAVISFFSSLMGVKTYLIITCSIAAMTIPVLLILFYKKEFTQFYFLFIALSLCPLLIYYAPNVQADFFHGRCSMWLAHEVLARVGNAPLYLYQPRDTIRGSIPFYGKRTVRELDLPEELRSVLLSTRKVFVLMDTARLSNLHKNKLLTNRYMVQPLPDCWSHRHYILLANLRD